MAGAMMWTGVESSHFLSVLYCGTDSLAGIPAWGLCDLVEMSC